MMLNARNTASCTNLFGETVLLKPYSFRVTWKPPKHPEEPAIATAVSVRTTVRRNDGKRICVLHGERVHCAATTTRRLLDSPDRAVARVANVQSATVDRDALRAAE